MQSFQQGPISEVISPDKNQAMNFLRILDQEVGEFTFQTFDDDYDRKDRSLAVVLNGTLDDHFHVLSDLNARGAGVFVTVNQTDGKGRKKENVAAIRAIWQEADYAETPDLPVQPHITVCSSPGKHHRYILVSKLTTVGQFEDLQMRMVDHYGSDPAAKDVSRVLRLPGFYHQKKSVKKDLVGTPHMVAIESYLHDGTPYTAEALQQALPMPIPRGRPKARVVNEEEDGPAYTLNAEPVVVGKEQVMQTIMCSPDPLRQQFHLFAGQQQHALVATSKTYDQMELTKLYSALEVIHPDDSYEGWLKILAALHDWTGGSEFGLEIADWWSARGNNYHGIEDVSAKWNSLTPGRGVTIASIYMVARENGWKGLTSITEPSPQVVNVVTETKKSTLEDFNKHHGLVKVNGKVLIINKEYNERTGTVVTEKMSIRDAEQLHLNKKITYMDDGDKIKSSPVLTLWKQWEERRAYKGLEFEPVPGLIADPTNLEMPDTKMYNLYQGMAVRPVAGECGRIINHIYETWCEHDDAHYHYIMGWLARMVQRPDLRAETSIVLHSGEGTGKNAITDILMDAFGDHSFTCTNSDHVTGKFNDNLGLSVFVVLNEATYGGDKRTQGALKALITDKTITIEQKFMPAIKVANHIHLMVLTNNDWVVPVGMDDRRFVVLDLNEKWKGNRNYFNELFDEINNGGKEAFIHTLMNWDISQYDPRVLPANRSYTKVSNQLRSSDSVTRWWVDVLMDGDFHSDTPIIGVDKWEEGEIKVPTKAFRSSYEQWCDSGNSRYKESVRDMNEKFKTLCSIAQRKKVRVKGHNNSLWGYNLPALDACRDSLNSAYNLNIEWE